MRERVGHVYTKTTIMNLVPNFFCQLSFGFICAIKKANLIFVSIQTLNVVPHFAQQALNPFLKTI